MGGNNDSVSGNPAPIRHGGGADELTDGRVLINAQTFGNAGDELQGIKLRLLYKFYRARYREGQRHALQPLGRKTQSLQRRDLLVNFTAAVHRVNKIVLLLKMTVDVRAQLAVALQRLLVGAQVQPSRCRIKLPDQFIVEQPVLGGNFGGGVFGNAAAEPIGLHQHIVHTGLLQQIRTQNSRQTAADDQHVGTYIFFKTIKAAYGRRFFPQ
ncbi:hypothetical protein SDC9_128953 [bioreactor metagenome]|uniref:Uncharacterized protein n=1 Tax=bioreactor metagenome TaxID=1076179 RepID=A0A645CXN1_9ZZZZ